MLSSRPFDWNLKHFLLLLLGVVGSVIVIGLVIAQDQETLKIRSALTAEDPAGLPYVASLVGGTVSGASAYDVLNNGDEIFPAMLDAIRSAKRRVNFETYIYEKGEVANQFTAVLAEAARRGVKVNLVVDAMGSGSMDAGHLEQMSSAGCQMFVFNKPHWYRLEEVNYRTHRKILVVDGQMAFVGGVGVADHWRGHAEDKNHWRDIMVRVRGPVARLLDGAFYENFIEAGEVVQPELDVVGETVGNPDTLVVRSAPSGGSSDLKRLYLLSIAIARKRIDIQSPYFISDESSFWAIKDAIGRGVVIRVLMESDRTDALPVKYASRSDYDALLSLGVQLYEYQPTMMHAKLMVVDEVWSMFGSANFDNRSLELNDEINVAVTSRGLAAHFTKSFERDLQSAHRLTLEEWRARPIFDRTRERFWSLFGEIF